MDESQSQMSALGNAPTTPISETTLATNIVGPYYLASKRTEDLQRCLSQLRYLSRLNSDPSCFWANTVLLSPAEKAAALPVDKVADFYCLAETVAQALSACKVSSHALCGFLLQAFAEADHCFADVSPRRYLMFTQAAHSTSHVVDARDNLDSIATGASPQLLKFDGEILYQALVVRRVPFTCLSSQRVTHALLSVLVKVYKRILEGAKAADCSGEGGAPPPSPPPPPPPPPPPTYPFVEPLPESPLVETKQSQSLTDPLLFELVVRLDAAVKAHVVAPLTKGMQEQATAAVRSSLGGFHASRKNKGAGSGGGGLSDANNSGGFRNSARRSNSGGSTNGEGRAAKATADMTINEEDLTVTV
mmetsp:Transcript_35195/g.71739  ORF Transcript_35195/g.71739 Transcript_35195/m.71739 type:complete len:361 (+) Transcript_35195:1-1083(+)